jgi:DMSO/TMAO reductase YedYZ molybdopterin-dependent catalytic subunit
MEKREAGLPLPPNQQLVAPGKWPVVGEKGPRDRKEPWTVQVTGLVERPRTWTLEELRALPQVEQVIDIHCVTRWSRPGAIFRGVPLERLLEECRPRPEACFISFVARSERGHSTSLPLAEAVELGTLVGLECDGEPLDEEHGGPVRTVVPGRYFYKSLKWLERIELLAEDRLGYWEAEAGYHNAADPWREQRYMAPSLDRRTVREVLAAKDFSGRDLRSIDASSRDLTGLKARGALLRDANFRNARLADADFSNANLSNAHLHGADLHNASFIGADVEGADFCSANLRGADFTGASLFGATFIPTGGGAFDAVRMDASTRIDPEGIEKLAPVQQEFVREALGLA